MWAKQKGFTIVELLIVIVVIAILASITVVAYTGVQNRAKDSAHRQEVAQVEKAILTHAALEARQESGVAGTLIGYSERSAAATTNEVKLLRPINGTPDVTFYMACQNTTAIDSTFVSAALLRPSSAAANIRFQSSGGTSAMGFRVDTSAQSNITKYETGIRTLGVDYIGWIRISDAGRRVTFNYNTAAQNQEVPLNAHSGWSFDALVVGGDTTCEKTIGLLFESAHDESTRQVVIDWVTKRLNMNI